MLVQLCKLDGGAPITSFKIGTHALGRGPNLQCNDKRISRNHAMLEISADYIKLSAVHTNPCFVKASNGSMVTILKKDNHTELKEGDSFAFLPDGLWFKVKLANDLDTGPARDENAPSLQEKRALEADHESDSKRVRVDANGALDTPTTTHENGAEADKIGAMLDSILEEETNKLRRNDVPENTTLTEDCKENENNSKTLDKTKNVENIASPEVLNVAPNDNVEEINNMPETELVAGIEDIADPDIGITENKTEAVEGNDGETSKKDEENQAGPSKVKSRRERCYYSSQCYRKSESHRREFTHPGDSDYESDPNDNRPMCSYGATCYRKNKDHRMNYKHPPKQKPGTKKRLRKNVDRLNVADSGDYAEFSDQEDDPYGTDESDDFVQDFDDEDSDWEDSQNVDDEEEDSGMINTLVKEAKRFARK